MLKTDPENSRAWAVGAETGRVVFSVDYAEDRMWPEDEPQPAWAMP